MNWLRAALVGVLVAVLGMGTATQASAAGPDTLTVYPTSLVPDWSSHFAIWGRVPEFARDPGYVLPESLGFNDFPYSKWRGEGRAMWSDRLIMLPATVVTGRPLGANVTVSGSKVVCSNGGIAQSTASGGFPANQGEGPGTYTRMLTISGLPTKDLCAEGNRPVVFIYDTGSYGGKMGVSDPSWDQSAYLTRRVGCVTSYSSTSYTYVDWGTACPSSRPYPKRVQLRAGITTLSTWDAPSAAVWNQVIGAQLGDVTLGYTDDEEFCPIGPDVPEEQRRFCRELRAQGWCDFLQRDDDTGDWSPWRKPDPELPDDWWTALVVPDPEDPDPFVLPTLEDCQRMEQSIQDQEEQVPPESVPPVDLGPVIRELQRIREEIQRLRDDVKDGVGELLEGIGGIGGGGGGSAPTPGAGEAFNPGDGASLPVPSAEPLVFGAPSDLMGAPAADGLTGMFEGFGVTAEAKLGPWRDAVSSIAQPFETAGACECRQFEWDLPLSGAGSVVLLDTCSGYLSQFTQVSRAASGAVVVIGSGMVSMNFIMSALGFVGLMRERSTVALGDASKGRGKE